MTSESPQSRHERAAEAIAELIELLTRSLASRRSSNGLNPAQWSALRYFHRSDESARNVGAFAKFRKTTPSSASQTISTLVKKNLIVKMHGSDRRVRTLRLSAEGRRTLKGDPIVKLKQALQGLPESKLFGMAEIMDFLTRGERL